MKLITALMLMICMQIHVIGYGQTITIHEKNVSIEKVLLLIEKQTNYHFIYDSKLDILKTQMVSINADHSTINTVLDQCLKGLPITYTIIQQTIALKGVPNSTIKKTSSAVFKVTGKITDANEQPLPGVTVKVSDSPITTITNTSGEFVINAPDGQSILVFSSIGFETKQVNINNQSTIETQLIEKKSALNEVIVVSYGSQNREDITGSIVQLNAGNMKDMPVGQFAQQLQGKVAGVLANINTGKPGQGIEIQIRGAASINAGNYPLIVIDGQPLSPVGGTNPINNINPNEIESFTILKDAAATALYGSRGGSGVILITTKQAKEGKTRIDFDAYYGSASLDKSHIPQMMDAFELATFMKEFFEDKIKYENYINPLTGTASVPAEYANPSQYGKGTNWLNQVMRTAPTQSYNLSISNAREKSSTSIIAGYFNQQGIVLNTGFERYSFRANNEFRPVKGIKIGFNVAPSYQIDHNSLGSPTDGSRQIIEGALVSSPITPAYNPDGTPVNQASGFFLLAEPNWRLVAQNQNNIYKTLRMLGNSYVQIDFLKSLTFKTSFNIDIAGVTNNRFVNQIAAASFNAPPPRPISAITGFYNTDNYTSWVNENLLTYKTTFLKDHHIEALGGYSIQKFSEYTSAITGTNYPDASIPFISGAGSTTGTSGLTQWALISMFGRLDYNYKEKYLFETSVRQDGSSKFGSNKKYGVFPTVSLGWVVSNEPFLKSLPVIDFLKIRTSYGLTGNNNFNNGNYPSVSLISSANYIFNNTPVGGKYPSQLGNDDLTWEKNKQFDLGFDIGILNNRISFNYDYYHKFTDGLLYQVNIPQSSGFSNVSSNIGAMKFWGHEFTVNAVNLTGAFKWNTSFNITFNRNRIEKLGTQNLPIMPANVYAYPNIQMVGQPIGMFYGYVVDGVYMNQQQFNSQPKDVTSTVGSVRMKDINGDGKITTDDRTIIGNPNPDFLYGMTNTFNYKNFDLSIVFAGSYGGQIGDPIIASDGANLDGAFNLKPDQLDHWRSEADPGNGLVPRTLANTTALYRTFNTNEVKPGSYLTCKNIAIGYNLKLHNNKYINKLRIYCSIQQAFTITRYPEFSPETTNQGSANVNGLTLGVDYIEYPIPRTISVGVNMGLF